MMNLILGDKKTEKEDDGIARYEEAFSIFEYHQSHVQLLADLEEVGSISIFIVSSRSVAASHTHPIPADR